MKKDPNVYLEHIVDSIEDILEYTQGFSRKQFRCDKMVQDAVIRKLSIIGEASKKLPKEFRLQHKEIDWDAIAGMRDVLIHDYFGVSVDIVWDTVKRDLPGLTKKLGKLL